MYNVMSCFSLSACASRGAVNIPHRCLCKEGGVRTLEVMGNQPQKARDFQCPATCAHCG